MGPILVLDIAYAAGIAFSPTPIIVLILILFAGIACRRERGFALAYLIGWVVGLTALGIVFAVLARAGTFLAGLASDAAKPVIPLLVGLALLSYARAEWRRAGEKKEQTAMPRWLKGLDKVVSQTGDVMTPGRALVLAVIMSAVSPKNMMLVFALCLALGQSDLPDNQQFVLLVLFVLLGSLTIGVPVIYVLMKGDSAGDTLMTWKTWILENTTRLAAVFAGSLGVVMVIKSVAEIVGEATIVA